MKNKGLIKYLGIILIGCILLFWGMRVWAEEEEKESEKVEIRVWQDEYRREEKKYLVTKEERDRIFRMRDAVNETVGAIEEAYRNREIDLDTKLMCKVKALEEPAGVPEKYRSSKYGKDKPDLKYHQDGLKRVLREVHKKWLETRIDTHSKIWSSEIFPYLKEYIEKKTEREREIFGYESLYISPTDAYVIRDAYLIREIDLDQMMLYIYGPPEETPAKFLSSKSTKIPKPIPFDIIIPSPYVEMLPLVRYSRYLRAETKEKIKLHRWKGLAERRGNRVGIGIDSPKEGVNAPSRYGPTPYAIDAVYKDGKWKILKPEGGAKVYTASVKIKGKITSPEMYDITSVWASVGGKRKEIKLGPSIYEKPSFFDEKYLREYYEKYRWERFGEKLKVDDFVMDYERGPGKIIRPFEVEVELPHFDENIISIGATNSGGQSASANILVTYYDVTDKEPPKVKIVKPKDGAVLGFHDTYEGKGEEIVVFCEATDDKRVLWVEVYVNDEFVERAFRTDREHIGYEKNGNSIWADYYRLGAPAKIGKNKIRAIAYDIGNNTKSDTIEVIYSPEKK